MGERADIGEIGKIGSRVKVGEVGAVGGRERQERDSVRGRSRTRRRLSARRPRPQTMFPFGGS